MKNYHDLQRQIFSLRRMKCRLEFENEKLAQEKEILEKKIDELKELVQSHLPSKKEFFLWQEGRGRLF